jgi:two-component system cell cycle sensor histidine kinase/response regulator CckA
MSNRIRSAMARVSVAINSRAGVVARERAAALRQHEELLEARRSADLVTDAERRYRELVEQVPAVVYLDRIDPDPRLTSSVYISPRVLDLTGYSDAEMVADPELWGRLVADADKESYLAAMRRLYETGDPFNLEYQLIGRDGRLRWVRDEAAVMHDEAGRRTHVRGVVIDVTERRLLEDQLRQAQKMEAVGQLAGGVAHDFNNLLTAITGHADLLRVGLTDDDPTREDVEAILQASASATALVRQLLAFGRKQILRPETLDLSGVVNDVVPMLRRLIGEHIALVTDLGAGLESVRADPNQIEQVIVNLSVNARDAMPDGGMLTLGTSHVDVDEAEADRNLGLRPGQYVVLTVADTGVGMTREIRERIFEPFFTTKGPGRGTGLGLATVFGIVKQSGGYIAVSSAAGRGTTFQVFLPPSATVPGEASPRVAANPTAIAPGTGRILVAEDDPAVRTLAVLVLARAGYDVIEAQSGAAAVELLRRSPDPVDVLVSDMVMPGMGGIELARHVAREWPDVGIVLMSGYAEEAVAQSDRLSVASWFLPKPFTPEQLGATVRDAIADRSSRDRSDFPLTAEGDGPRTTLADESGHPVAV